MKTTIKESELKEIISKTIKKYLKEEKTLLTTTYHNQNLIVKNYDIENDEDREFIFKNKDLIWDILVNSYASLGGFKGFKTQKDMLKKCPFYRLGFCDNEIITVTVYNDYLGGNKCVGVGTVKDERHRQSVALLDLIIKYNIENWNQWVWVEASEKIEEMCKKNGGFNLPSQYAFLYLKGKPYTKTDEYHYIRKIDNTPVEKTIFGFKDMASFEILNDLIGDKINNFLNKKNLNESENNIYQLYLNKLDEIYKYKDIVDYFVYLKDDEHINEFPEQTMNILYDAIKNIKKLLTEKEYGKREKYILELTIEEGERVIKTSTIFAPSYL